VLEGGNRGKEGLRWARSVAYSMYIALLALLVRPLRWLKRSFSEIPTRFITPYVTENYNNVHTRRTGVSWIQILGMEYSRVTSTLVVAIST
jgi:hypothetical protein